MRDMPDRPTVGRESVPQISSVRKVSIHNEAAARVLYELEG